MKPTSDGPKLTLLGKLFVVLFILACVAGAYYLFAGKKTVEQTRQTAANLLSGGPPVEIGIAYGTEKQRWLEWAVSEFAKTTDGKRITINLIPMGSLEGAHAILSGDKRINVWSPASATYKDTFVQEWQVKNSGNPIIKEEPLALTPMVFVMWDERYKAFIQKYKVVSLDTINQALQEKTGWDAIAHQPDWGLFKFGHTHPNQSNSGLMTIVLAAYAYHHKTKDLTVADVVNAGFQQWLGSLERGTSGLSNSTGNMMKEMVLKGPSSYDALLVYESVAIDYLKNGGVAALAHLVASHQRTDATLLRMGVRQYRSRDDDGAGLLARMRRDPRVVCLCRSACLVRGVDGPGVLRLGRDLLGVSGHPDRYVRTEIRIHELRLPLHRARRRLDPGWSSRGLSQAVDGELDLGIHHRGDPRCGDRTARHHRSAPGAQPASAGRLKRA